MQDNHRPDELRPVRVLVVEDDPDTAFFVKYTLSKADFEVTFATNIAQALLLTELAEVDVVLSDFELPDGNALTLADAMAKRDQPIPVIVTTAHEAVDRALTALGAPVAHYLLKPVHPDVLIATVQAIGRQQQGTRSVVLAIGAHPGDIESGIGGALLAHRDAGHEVVLATFVRGDRSVDLDGRTRETQASEARDAAELLGARLLVHDLDEAADEAALGALIHDLVSAFSPDIVYTYSAHDADESHRAVHRASVAASAHVPTVACYQAASTTPLFQPTRFVDVSEHADEKRKLIGFFDSSSSRGCGSTDVRMVAAAALYWSRFSSGSYAEPLEVVRHSFVALAVPVPAEAAVRA